MNKEDIILLSKIKTSVDMGASTILYTGSSPSVGININIDGSSYYGKIFFIPKNKGLKNCIENEALEYELNINEKIIPTLLDHSSNFIKFFKKIEFLKDTNDTTSDKVRSWDQIELIMEGEEKDDCGVKVYIDGHYVIMLTDYIDGIPLSSFIRKQMTSEVFFEILSQIIISIKIMTSLKIQHNDLHSENIIIKELPSETLLVYTLKNGKEFYIKTKYKVYIIDWNNGYVENLGDNPYLTKRKTENYDNKIDVRFEIFIFLCSLYFELQVIEENKKVFKDFKKYINNHIQNINSTRELIDQEKGFYCRLLQGDEFRSKVFKNPYDVITSLMICDSYIFKNINLIE